MAWSVKKNNSNSFEPHVRYPGLRGFYWLARERRRATSGESGEAARREKPLVILDLNLTFMQTPAVKTPQIDNFKRDQWQISYHASPRYYQLNEPIILICVFVKISTNPSLRVRSWPWYLHESEIQVQGKPDVFLFLPASLLSHSSRKTSGTRVHVISIHAERLSHCHPLLAQFLT